MQTKTSTSWYDITHGDKPKNNYTKRPLNVYFLAFLRCNLSKFITQVYIAVSSWRILFINFVKNCCISPLRQMHICDFCYAWHTTITVNTAAAVANVCYRDMLTCMVWSKDESVLAVGTHKGNLLIYNHRSARCVWRCCCWCCCYCHSREYVHFTVT